MTTHTTSETNCDWAIFNKVPMSSGFPATIIKCVSFEEAKKLRRVMIAEGRPSSLVTIIQLPI